MKKKLDSRHGDWEIEKPVNFAPEIHEQFVDDDGVPTYILANGNTQPVDSYNRIWNPQKEKVLPFNHKGDNPAKTWNS